MTVAAMAGTDMRPGPAISMLPRALLLDEGGVLSLSGGNDGAAGPVAARIAEMIGRAGIDGPDVAQIEADIRCGKNSYRAFKARHLIDPHPLEIDHRVFWQDLVAWPAPARALAELECRPWSELLSAGNRRRPAPGAVDLLTWARAEGIRIGLVANTFAARTTRRRLADWGLAEFLCVQVHSDETGIRKPDPKAIWIACWALDLDPAEVWFVGDNYDRDVRCARRAGAGRAVLMRPADRIEPAARPQPDDVVRDGFGLLALVRAATGTGVSENDRARGQR